LKQTKKEWALSEEKKEESELALKNEIKYLINKLILMKNGNANLSASHLDMSQLSKGNLSKSFHDLNTSYTPIVPI